MSLNFHDCLYYDDDDCYYDGCYDHAGDGDCCNSMKLLRKTCGVKNDDAEIASGSEIDRLCSYLLMVSTRKIFVSLPVATRIGLFSMAPTIIELRLLSGAFQILC